MTSSTLDSCSVAFGRTDIVDLMEPGNCFLAQVSIIVEAAADEKVTLDELNQVLDRAFLVGSTRRTEGWVEAKLGY